MYQTTNRNYWWEARANLCPTRNTTQPMDSKIIKSPPASQLHQSIQLQNKKYKMKKYIQPTINLSIYRTTTIQLPIYVSINLFKYIYYYTFISTKRYTYAHLSISIHLSTTINQSVYLSIYLPIYLPIFNWLSVYLSIYI
jgi:hypothetical protein